jgi:hypothetical protein
MRDHVTSHSQMDLGTCQGRTGVPKNILKSNQGGVADGWSSGRQNSARLSDPR